VFALKVLARAAARIASIGWCGPGTVSTSNARPAKRGMIRQKYSGMIEVLLGVLIGLLILRIWRAERHHRENGKLFSAFATMIGEALDVWYKERKREKEED